MDDGHITVTIDLDGIEQTQCMALPCLLTLEKEINTPRLPSYLRKKASSSDQIEICSLSDFPQADVTRLGGKGSPTKVERIFSPEVRETLPLITGSPDELSAKLYDVLTKEKFV